MAYWGIRACSDSIQRLEDARSAQTKKEPLETMRLFFHVLVTGAA